MKSENKSSLEYKRSCQKPSKWLFICREFLSEADAVLASFGYKKAGPHGKATRVAAFTKSERRLFLRVNEERILVECFPQNEKRSYDLEGERTELFALGDLILSIDGGAHGK